jgi:hypothetical protein
MVLVGIGCGLGTAWPAGRQHRVLSILVPLIFVVLARPETQQAVLACGRRLLSRKDRRMPRQNEQLRWRPTFGGSLQERPYRTNTSSSAGSFLRSFDRLEEILQEALMLEIGEIAREFALRETVQHLEKTGFLTSIDRNVWADCLAVRRSLLMTGNGLPMLSRQTVESALAMMLQLQVTLIDRRRALFDAEQMIRQQEDTALRHASAKIDPLKSADQSR